MRPNLRHAAILFGILLVGGVSAETTAEKQYKEDLSAVTLPHGELLLPDRNDPRARQGYILRFSDRKLNVLPFKGDQRPRTIAGFFQRLRAERTGDLIYSRASKGALVAISGRISDLGEKFLHDLSGQRLTRPPVVYGEKQRSGSGEKTAGLIEGVRDGHCYLVETVTGKYAVVRMVQKRGRLALIQYVYQPNGSLVFDIPQGKRIEVAAWAPPARRTRPWRLPAPSVKEKVTDIHSLLAAREKMIAKLIATVKQPAKTPQQIMAKGQAVRALGTLRARRAAVLLAKDISFRDPYVLSSEATLSAILPCLGALQSIGKPGSLAAMDEIGKIKLGGDAATVTKAKFRLRLLVMVVSGLEGREVAEFMIQARMKKAPAESRDALALALKILPKD